MDYKEINQKLWDLRTDVHKDSAFYNVEEFLKGKSSLNQIELDLLGNIEGKSVVHLQCHFGMDSISLSRLGAKVTAIDLSPKAIELAKELNAKTNQNVEFICCDVYDVPNHITKQFDYVFTSYGTIGWLPDINQWANVISERLKPNGQFIMVEFHPVVWMFDDDFTKITYKYSSPEPIIENLEGTYTDSETKINEKSVSWNHGISDVLNALINQNINIKQFNEIDYSVYDCFKHTVEFEKGKFRIKNFDDKIPMMYSILGEKMK